MKTMLSKAIIAASLALAATFTLNCSSDDGNDSKNSETSSSSESGEGSSSSGGSNGEIAYGDSVEFLGETYPTVVIGTQTWFAKNLNYDVGGSKCPNDEPADCETYGRLYNWATAMGFLTSDCPVGADCAPPLDCAVFSCADLIDAKHQGICPNGWHIPSIPEWNELFDYVDTENDCSDDWRCQEKHLKAASGTASGWADNLDSGEDTYGFAALSARRYDAYWWSSTEYNAKNAARIAMGYPVECNESLGDNKTCMYSVRCVRD